MNLTWADTFGTTYPQSYNPDLLNLTKRRDDFDWDKFVSVKRTKKISLEDANFSEVSIEESEEGITQKFLLAGVEKDNLKVTIVNNPSKETTTVKFLIKDTEKETTKDFLAVSDETHDYASLKVSLNNGILSVFVPFKNPTKTTEVPVE